jgi:hypothetical protein
MGNWTTLDNSGQLWTNLDNWTALDNSGQLWTIEQFWTALDNFGHLNNSGQLDNSGQLWTEQLWAYLWMWSVIGGWTCSSSFMSLTVAFMDLCRGPVKRQFYFLANNWSASAVDDCVVWLKSLCRHHWMNWYKFEWIWFRLTLSMGEEGP